MKTVLLVLLVGELTAPLRPHLEAALPAAFGGAVPEVALGAEAPPGRTVAWVTASGDDVELVLHTARVPGDLRRVLRFSPQDTPPERARAVAFALSALVKEREAALATSPPIAPPALPAWRLGARGVLLLGLSGEGVSGGGLVEAQRALPWNLALGVGLEVTAGAAGSASLVQPAGWAQVSWLPFQGARVTPRLSIGGGVTGLVLAKAQATSATVLGLLRTSAEAEVTLVGPHRLSVGVVMHVTTGRVAVPKPGQGGGQTEEVGPLWLRGELGYLVAF